MPVPILTSLLLWSALLLLGGKADSMPAVRVSQSVGRWEAGSLSIVERITIQSLSMDQDHPWTISEADTEEEESSDGDPEGIISDSRRNWLSMERGRSLLAIRLDPGLIRTPIRSPILRC